MSALKLYHTPPQPCGYLAGRAARNLVADPSALDASLYQRLISRGFRRSGDYVYRPACSGCRACVPLRVPAARFRPDRSMRRTRRRNEDLRLTVTPARGSGEPYDLFRRYLQARHAGGEMARSGNEELSSFLLSSWCQTLFLELRLQNGELVAVAVTDRLADGLSAVYTFFAPELPERSLGTLAVLEQIALARSLDLPWLYLGYWVEGCRKMSYKCRFRPHQVLTDEGWREPG